MRIIYLTRNIKLFTLLITATRAVDREGISGISELERGKSETERDKNETEREAEKATEREAERNSTLNDPLMSVNGVGLFYNLETSESFTPESFTPESFTSESFSPRMFESFSQEELTKIRNIKNDLYENPIEFGINNKIAYDNKRKPLKVGRMKKIHEIIQVLYKGIKEGRDIKLLMKIHLGQLFALSNRLINKDILGLEIGNDCVLDALDVLDGDTKGDTKGDDTKGDDTKGDDTKGTTVSESGNENRPSGQSTTPTTTLPGPVNKVLYGCSIALMGKIMDYIIKKSNIEAETALRNKAAEESLRRSRRPRSGVQGTGSASQIGTGTTSGTGTASGTGNVEPASSGSGSETESALYKTSGTLQPVAIYFCDYRSNIIKKDGFTKSCLLKVYLETFESLKFYEKFKLTPEEKETVTKHLEKMLEDAKRETVIDLMKESKKKLEENDATKVGKGGSDSKGGSDNDKGSDDTLPSTLPNTLKAPGTSSDLSDEDNPRRSPSANIRPNSGSISDSSLVESIRSDDVGSRSFAESSRSDGESNRSDGESSRSDPNNPTLEELRREGITEYALNRQIREELKNPRASIGLIEMGKEILRELNEEVSSLPSEQGISSEGKHEQGSSTEKQGTSSTEKQGTSSKDNTVIEDEEDLVLPKEVDDSPEPSYNKIFSLELFEIFNTQPAYIKQTRDYYQMPSSDEEGGKSIDGVPSVSNDKDAPGVPSDASSNERKLSGNSSVSSSENYHYRPIEVDSDVDPETMKIVEGYNRLQASMARRERDRKLRNEFWDSRSKRWELEMKRMKESAEKNPEAKSDSDVKGSDSDVKSDSDVNIKSDSEKEKKKNPKVPEAKLSTETPPVTVPGAKSDSVPETPPVPVPVPGKPTKVSIGTQTSFDLDQKSDTDSVLSDMKELMDMKKESFAREVEKFKKIEANFNKDMETLNDHIMRGDPFNKSVREGVKEREKETEREKKTGKEKEPIITLPSNVIASPSNVVTPPSNVVTLPPANQPLPPANKERIVISDSDSIFAPPIAISDNEAERPRRRVRRVLRKTKFRIPRLKRPENREGRPSDRSRSSSLRSTSDSPTETNKSEKEGTGKEEGNRKKKSPPPIFQFSHQTRSYDPSDDSSSEWQRRTTIQEDIDANRTLNSYRDLMSRAGNKGLVSGRYSSVIGGGDNNYVYDNNYAYDNNYLSPGDNNYVYGSNYPLAYLHRYDCLCNFCCLEREKAGNGNSWIVDVYKGGDDEDDLVRNNNYVGGNERSAYTNSAYASKALINYTDKNYHREIYPESFKGEYNGTDGFKSREYNDNLKGSEYNDSTKGSESTNNSKRNEPVTPSKNSSPKESENTKASSDSKFNGFLIFVFILALF